MKKFTLFLVCLLIFFANVRAEQARVPQARWTSVGMGYSLNSFITVKQVDFRHDYTEIAFHIDFIANRTIGFTSKIYLFADGKQYPVRSAAGLELDETFTLPPHGKADFTMTFDALPTNTKHFDLVEPNSYTLTNIHNQEDIPTSMENTYWRNDASGDWLIGFTRQGVIYDCKVWEIKQQDNKKGKHEFTIFDATSHTTKKVSVGKLKKGHRFIAIDDEKIIACSPITTTTLPYYPEKDTISSMRDNGYQPGDSAILVGWLKDMPKAAWSKGTEFEVDVNNFFTDEEETFSAKMDSLGRFTLKVPLINSSQAYLDWTRTNKEVYLEPGETYYFLYDCHTGQYLFMGKNCRVQNELLSHSFKRLGINAGEEVKTNKESMTFLWRTDSARKSHTKALDEELTQYPTLSTRFANYLKGWYRANQASTVMQGLYYYRPLPTTYMEYAGKEFWQKISQPFTLHKSNCCFIYDYTQALMRQKNVASSLRNILFSMERKGRIVLSDTEKILLDQYEKETNRLLKKINEQTEDSARTTLVENFNKSRLAMDINDLIGIHKESLPTFSTLFKLDIENLVLDSLSCTPQLRDAIQARHLIDLMEQTRQPLNSALLNFAEQEIQLPAANKQVRAFHKKYLKLQQGEIAYAASLHPSSNVANMTDGEKILRKLLAPHKGKLVYLDIWGAWCGPCIRNISQSHKLKEALKSYDIVYLYLANNTSDSSWKNVIKEYQLTGKNIVHYNLPAAQQKAVENYLNVSGYPTYKLIDKRGNIHDLHWLHMEKMDQFIKQIDSLNK